MRPYWCSQGRGSGALWPWQGCIWLAGTSCLILLCIAVDALKVNGAPVHADIGRQRAPQSVGQPQCSVAAFGGNNDVQGAPPLRR